MVFTFVLRVSVRKSKTHYTRSHRTLSTSTHKHNLLILLLYFSHSHKNTHTHSLTNIERKYANNKNGINAPVAVILPLACH